MSIFDNAAVDYTRPNPERKGDHPSDSLPAGWNLCVSGNGFSVYIEPEFKCDTIVMVGKKAMTKTEFNKMHLREEFERFLCQW